jgi:hypothetical protein
MPESMQFDEHELRLEARLRVARGRLPSQLQQYLWAGAGDGQQCSLCDRPIHPQQIEYELQFSTHPQTVYRFHRICHQAWELECIESTHALRSLATRE